MLTNEKVLEVFQDYLLQETSFEVVETHHGYTAMYWDKKCEDWIDFRCCKTPYELLDELLNSYESYLNEQITNSMRELTKREKRHIQKKKNEIRQKCNVYLDINSMAN